MQIGLTVLEGQSSDDIPADTADINPANLYPRLAFAGLGVVEEIDQLLVGHALKPTANARVVYYFDLTVLSYMSIVEICRVLADVDAGFGARTITHEATRGLGDVHHFPHGHAEALDWGEGRLGVDLRGLGGHSSV